MLELIEGVTKGLRYLLDALISSGTIWDISLSGTGRFVIKAFYPPHWFKSVSYNKFVERLVGFAAWILLGYGCYYLNTIL